METVVITGCSSGIGRATALAFLEADWTVYATARDPRDIADLGEAGCETATLDVTDEDQVEGVVDRIEAETGRIDCLVNNAGYAQFGPLEDLPTPEVERQFDVNVYGPHRLARAVLPHMREREDGTIVNLSSIAGRIALPGSGAYSASKFALEAMSDALRAEVAPFGVDVVLVEPGPVDTAFSDRAMDELDRGIERSDAYGSLYRLLEDSRWIGSGPPFRLPPDEVAAAILNAASSTDPDPRYPVGPVAKSTGLLRLVPGRFLDRAYRLATTFVR